MGASPPPTKASGADEKTVRTVAVVNDSVISTFDLDQRVRLLLVTSGQNPTPDLIKRYRPQVLKTLIDEMLQTQEAFKFKVQVGNEEVDKSVARIAQQNNAQVNDIFKMLESQGVTRGTLQGQLRTELAWQKFVQGRFSSRVVISPDEVKEVLERTQANANKSQFLVSEIFLAIDSPEQEPEVRKNLEQIIAQLRQGAPFTVLARQFSQSASAARGGDIDWVTEGQLEPELNTVLTKMRPGSISDPVRAAGGLYLLALRQKQTAAGSKPEENDQPEAVPVATGGQPEIKVIKGPSAQVGLARLLIPMDASANKAKQEAAKQKAVALYRGVNGCGQPLQALAKQVGGVQVNAMGTIALKDLAPDFRKLLEQTPNGRPSPPLRSGQGIEMFVICSGGAQIQVTQPAGPARAAAPRTEAFKMPTKEDIENRLFSQQINMLARRHLRDLRRDATIEIKDQN